MNKTDGFKTHFKPYACNGDSITCTVDGFDVTARIYNHHCSYKPDEHQYGFWPSLDPKSAGYIGAKSKSTLARHTAKAQRVMQAWKDDEWWYVGVAVTVSRNGVELTGKYDHAIWGIECNYPGSKNHYLRDVANELLGEAIADAESILDQLLMDYKGAA